MLFFVKIVFRSQKFKMKYKYHLIYFYRLGQQKLALYFFLEGIYLHHLIFKKQHSILPGGFICICRVICSPYPHNKVCSCCHCPRKIETVSTKFNLTQNSRLRECVTLSANNVKGDSWAKVQVNVRARNISLKNTQDFQVILLPIVQNIYL